MREAECMSRPKAAWVMSIRRTLGRSVCLFVYDEGQGAGGGRLPELGVVVEGGYVLGAALGGEAFSGVD